MFCERAQRKVQEARADRRIGHAVDQDEAAGVVVLLVGVERDRLIEREVADADFVEFKLLGGALLERIDVYAVARAP